MSSSRAAGSARLAGGDAGSGDVQKRGEGGGTLMPPPSPLFVKRVTSSAAGLEVVGVENLVGAVVGHHAVDVVLRLVEADLGGEDARVFVDGAHDPARDVVLAAVVGGGDGLGQVGEHPEEFAEVGAPQRDVDLGAVEVVLAHVLE